MLPDIGAAELMVIALVALVIVGPKDLPLMLRKLGQFTSRLRRMAADFRSSFDDMARQSELEDLRREVEAMRSRATDAVTDPLGVESALHETIDDIDMSISAPDEPYMTYEPEPPAAETPPTSPAKAPRKPKTASSKTASSKTASPKTTGKTAKAKAPIARKAAPVVAKKTKTSPTPRKRPAPKIVS